MSPVQVSLLQLSLFVLVVLLNTASVIAQDNSVSCNCEYQTCIDISQTLSPEGKAKSPEVTLKGFVATKLGEHPYKGEFESLVLTLEESVCFHGGLYTAGDSPQPVGYVEPNMTHIQLVLDQSNQEQFTGDNKGKPVEVTGTISEAVNAWHTTPLLLAVLP